MKKTRAVFLLLCASMVMSMTGCSGRKKAVIEAVDSYASALLAGDIDDITDLMEDDDEFKEAMESYLNRYTPNDKLEDIYEFILDNTTYEIDKKSLTVTDNKASLEITYTMIDYMYVYEDLDDDADAEDFLDELEDNTDNTIEIRQKIELKAVKDEWKIADADFENTLEVYEFYEEIYDLGFGGAGELTLEAFQAACEDVFENYYDYFYDEPSYDEICVFGDGIWAELCVCSEEGKAVSSFEFAYEGYQDMLNDDEFDGTSSAFYDGETGYILFDGHSTDVYFFEGDIYGGIFLSGDSYMFVVSESGSNPTVDELLRALGCPTP